MKIQLGVHNSNNSIKVFSKSYCKLYQRCRYHQLAMQQDHGCWTVRVWACCQCELQWSFLWWKACSACYGGCRDEGEQYSNGSVCLRHGRRDGTIWMHGSKVWAFGITKNAAAELGKFGVRVNCMAPFSEQLLWSLQASNSKRGVSTVSVACCLRRYCFTLEFGVDKAWDFINFVPDLFLVSFVKWNWAVPWLELELEHVQAHALTAGLEFRGPQLTCKLSF